MHGQEIPEAAKQLEITWNGTSWCLFADSQAWMFVHEGGASVAATAKKQAHRLCWHVEHHEHPDISLWQTAPVNNEATLQQGRGTLGPSFFPDNRQRKYSAGDRNTYTQVITKLGGSSANIRLPSTNAQLMYNRIQRLHRLYERLGRHLRNGALMSSPTDQQYQQLGQHLRLLNHTHQMWLATHPEAEDLWRTCSERDSK